MKKLNMKEHVFNWKSSRMLKVQVLTAGAVLAIGLAAVPAVTARADDAANVQSETAVSVAQIETGTEVQQTESDTPSVISVSRDDLPAASAMTSLPGPASCFSATSLRQMTEAWRTKIFSSLSSTSTTRDRSSRMQANSST